MTTKKKTQKRAGGKDSRTPEQLMVIPSAAAERLIADVAATFNAEDDTIGKFLLLLHSIVYSDEIGEREAYLFEAQRLSLPATNAFQHAVDELIETAVCKYRKEARANG